MRIITAEMLRPTQKQHIALDNCDLDFSETEVTTFNEHLQT